MLRAVAQPTTKFSSRPANETIPMVATQMAPETMLTLFVSSDFTSDHSDLMHKEHYK